MHRRFAIEHIGLPFQDLNLGLFPVHHCRRQLALGRGEERDCGFVGGLAQHNVVLAGDRMRVWGVVGMTVAAGKNRYNMRYETQYSRLEAPGQLILSGTECGRVDCLWPRNAAGSL